MPSYTFRLYLGSFTTERRRSRGDGIHVYEIEAETGACRHVQHIGGIENPSFFALNATRTRLYVAHGDLDYVSAYAIEPNDGQLVSLGTACTGGKNTVGLAVSPDGNHLITANYGSGNIGILPIDEEGVLYDARQVIESVGDFRQLRRVGHQDIAHPHDISFDPSGRFMVVPDKGLDGIFIYPFADGRAGQPRFVATRGGTGPRHIAWHPEGNIAWICNELDSSLTTYIFDPAEGTLLPIDIVPCLPPDFVGDNLIAEIAFHPVARALYVSNRGHDSIAMFHIGAQGLPEPMGLQQVDGRCPRHITIDPTGRFLWIANEESHTVERRRIDLATGRLHPSGLAIQQGSPVAVAFTFSNAQIT
jgi:6-phosphogluconolactonase (cycloisomerase 2 family)